MNRADYNVDQDVRGFLNWARPLISQPGAIAQRWTSPKFGTWSSDSVVNAYELFEWRFSVVLPGTTERLRGRSFAENVAVLDHLRHVLRESAARDDADTFLEAAIAVLHWGGVAHGNEGRLRALGDTALPALTAAACALNPAVADLRRRQDVRDMNSGFSKIYSLLLDGFPIYDSRVACAMASLVLLYCDEIGLRSVPSTLAFGIPASRGGRHGRDPSRPPLVFPKLRWGQPERYASSNVRAAWLLDALAEGLPIDEADRHRRQLVLQSAMFMIGYQPLGITEAVSDF